MSARFSFVRCRRCTLSYLTPRVPLAELGRYYGPSYLPHRGAAAWGRWAMLAEEGQRRTDRARVRWARGAVRLGRDTRVLDVGCGQPTFLEALVRATGTGAVGIDVSDAGWIGDAERWTRSGLELHRGLVHQAALEAPFNLICLWHALEHDYAPLDTLGRLRALVRPGGAIVVEVPNYESLTRRLHGTLSAGLHTPRHTALYTPSTLRTMLERAGWTVERQAKHGTLDPYVLWWLGRQERRLHLNTQVGQRIEIRRRRVWERWIGLDVVLPGGQRRERVAAEPRGDDSRQTYRTEAEGRA